MNRQKATLKELAESMPKSSLSARQYALVESATQGLEDVAGHYNQGEIDQVTALAALNMLRAAIDQESTILR